MRTAMWSLVMMGSLNLGIFAARHHELPLLIVGLVAFFAAVVGFVGELYGEHCIYVAKLGPTISIHDFFL